MDQRFGKRCSAAVISHTAKAFKEIDSLFALETSATFLSAHSQALKKMVADRKEMCMRPLHFAANILDPKIKGNFDLVN